MRMQQSTGTFLVSAFIVMLCAHSWDECFAQDKPSGGSGTARAMTQELETALKERKHTEAESIVSRLVILGDDAIPAMLECLKVKSLKVRVSHRLYRSYLIEAIETIRSDRDLPP